MEYRKRLYDYEGIIDLTERYGLPQDNQYGNVKYIEAQVWSDETIEKYRR